MSNSLSTSLLHGSLLHFVYSFSQLQVWFMKCFCFSDSQRSNSVHSIPMLDALLSVQIHRLHLPRHLNLNNLCHLSNWFQWQCSQNTFGQLFSISSANLQRLTVLVVVHDTLASPLSFSRYHFKVVLSTIVYILSER